MTKPILALRQLLSYNDDVKSFLKFTMNCLKFDWERTIQEKPDNFVFTNLDFVKQNLEGCPWFHIIVTKENTYIICRDNDETDDDCYCKHKVFNSETTVNRLIKKLETKEQPLYIISSNYIYFKELKNKQRYSDDYIEYKYEVLKQLRLQKCIELQLFKITYELCSDIKDYRELMKDSKKFKELIDTKLTQLLSNDKVKKWLYPIQEFNTRILDYEIDYSRKRCYIEISVDYKYLKYGELYENKYHTVMPSHYNFKNIIFTDNVYSVFVVTLFDAIIKLLGIFYSAFVNRDISLIINNCINNGFNNHLKYQFQKLL